MVMSSQIFLFILMVGSFFSLNSWALRFQMQAPVGFNSEIKVGDVSTFIGFEKTRPSLISVSVVDRPLPKEMFENKVLQEAYLQGLKQIFDSKKIINFKLQGIQETQIGSKKALIYSYTFIEGQEGNLLQGHTLLLEWDSKESLSIDFSALKARASPLWEETLKKLNTLVNSQKSR